MNKKYFRTTVSAFALILAFAGTNTTNAWAEDIEYNGTQADYDKFHSEKDGTYVTSHQSAVKNTVTVDNQGNLADDVYKAPDTVAGASVSNGTTSENTVTIQGKAKVTGDVYGAIVENGVAEKNKVVITDGQIGGRVMGGISKAGSANNNSVDFSGGNVTDVIYGGFGTSGSSGNTVTLNGGTAAAFILGGASSSGDVKNNSVVVNSGNYGMDIYAGYTDASGVVDSNILTLRGGKTTATVAGGRSSGDRSSGDASVSNNQVIMDGSANASVVAGGYIDGKGDAIGNSITISGNSVVDDLAVGGVVNYGNGAAKNNVATIFGDAVVNEIQGGATHTGIAQGNRLVIESGRVEFGHGGFSQSGSASQNTVVMSGGLVKHQIVGGRSEYNDVHNASAVSVSDNQVTITGGTVEYDVIGGAADLSGYVTGNVVTMSGDTTEVYGALIGGTSGYGDASDNIVNLNGGSVGKFVHGGEAAGRADRNKINVTGGTIRGSISGGIGNVGADSNQVLVSGVTVGGQVIAGDSADGSATNNVAVIKNAVVAGTDIIGYDETGGAVSGYVTINGNAENNKLIISDHSTINDSVFSGYTAHGNASGNSLIIDSGSHITQDVTGGKTLRGGDATNNIVSIEDATVDGNVYGGRTYGDNATSNLITLTGEHVTIKGTIYGGIDDLDTSTDVFTGNTLKLVHFRGDLGGIESVQNYNWILPKDVVNNDTLVHITGDNPVNLANTTHTVAIESDGNRLTVGDKITLIDKTANAPASTMEVKQGNFLIYDMKAEQSGNGYVLTTLNSQQIKDEKPEDNDSTSGNIDGNNNTGDTVHSDHNGSGSGDLAGRLNPQTKAFSEGRAASLGFLNQGADLIANAGIRAARSSVAEGGNNPWQMNLMPFFVIDGSSNRYKTGSHADVDGFNMAVGLATGFELADKHPVTLGAFFEYGRGTYDTYNSFANYASVHGDGDTHYTGGGVLGRIDFAGTGLGLVNKLDAGQADGLYAEASFRAGHLDTDFDTDDLLGEFGEGSDYDSGADYYGLHGGVGYVMNFDERNSVDVYGRYFWTKVDSETVDVGRDRLHFDEADSSRLRIGTRYTMIYNQQLKPYVGIAYDHEFDGEVAARAYGLKLDKPSLEGDTGIFEAGISMKPVSTIDALSVDVSGQGFIGRREGGGGGLKIKYQF